MLDVYNALEEYDKLCKTYNDIDTMFLLTNLKYSYLSSSVVKQVASYEGDISKFVTPYVAEKLKSKFNRYNV